MQKFKPQPQEKPTSAVVNRASPVRTAAKGRGGAAEVFARAHGNGLVLARDRDDAGAEPARREGDASAATETGEGLSDHSVICYHHRMTPARSNAPSHIAVRQGGRQAGPVSCMLF
jgi:hypothetical protein